MSKRKLSMRCGHRSEVQVVRVMHGGSCMHLLCCAADDLCCAELPCNCTGLRVAADDKPSSALAVFFPVLSPLVKRAMHRGVSALARYQKRHCPSARRAHKQGSRREQHGESIELSAARSHSRCTASARVSDQIRGRRNLPPQCASQHVSSADKTLLIICPREPSGGRGSKPACFAS